MTSLKKSLRDACIVVFLCALPVCASAQDATEAVCQNLFLACIEIALSGPAQDLCYQKQKACFKKSGADEAHIASSLNVSRELVLKRIQIARERLKASYRVD